MTTGQNLKRRREELSLTLAQAAGITGVNISNLSRIENGKVDCRLSTLSRITDAYDCFERQRLGESGRASGGTGESAA